MLKKLLVISIFSVLVLGCRKWFEKDISDEYKLEFLNEILRDTSFSFTEKDMISNYPLLTPMLHKGNSFVSESPAERIAKWLIMSDTTYVKSQAKKNKNLDLKKLEEYGLSVFDYKALVKDSIPYSKIRETIRSENIKRNLNEYQGLINVSKPIFNKDLNLAYIRFGGGCTGEPQYIFEKKQNGWEKHNLDHWIDKHDLMDPEMKKLFEDNVE